MTPPLPASSQEVAVEAEAEVAALVARYEEEPEHVTHVAALADALFLALAPWHGRGEGCRLRLRAAALLHDIGWSQTPDGRGHHKESARLIGEWKWKTLPPGEIALVAQIARYHRKSVPRPDHAAYTALPPDHRRTVSVLGGLLRIADALDRTHTQRIATLRARIAPTEIVVLVTPKPGGAWDEERAMAEKKKDLLEAEAQRPVRFEAA
ncbi:exopolyphosphatase / guanosine-5'-triphosphate,3'-diphosphate pyrophosphatase [Verrucomicrobium sp. GAS474]|uniref:HD domain-containing protein n=1 Tax=Verrucomicrobium sp. GAS474 TaxID=1882831 RepID=UPI00087DDDBE|nr:HD domain-containing protein [Verrucomicrobium sp. GAS474]SDT99195.1 exopolyphosphatase / guanosine-5'-triphosphate,3'-diphosphate pyrophosphatase [Verrucomicrobium sp. GAS474]